MSELRDVTVDEVFTWRDDSDGTFALKAKDAFGSNHAYANNRTYAEIKERCDAIELRREDYRAPFDVLPINSFHIHIEDSVPDGILRGKP